MAALNRPLMYNDLYFRLAISLLAAHIIVAFGAKQSFFQLLLMYYYYRSLTLSFFIAFSLINTVYLVTVKLDKHFDWIDNTAKRIGLQFAFGLILPSVAAFLLATLYFALFRIKILDTGYLQFDFPVIVIMLLLLNVYYLAFYFYNRWRHAENKATGMSGHKQVQVFTVQKGAKNIPLPIDTVSYFYHDGQYNFLRTFDREDFLVSQPLDEVQQHLNDKQFFRANRQMIVNIKACDYFQNMDHHKLELFTKPSFKSQVVISQKRASAFKSWMNGK